MEEHLLCRVFLLFVTFLVIASAKVLNATVGDNVDLPCEGPQGTVVGLLWTQSDRTVLIYRSGRIEKTQDERFTNRVELLDPEMKSGNLGVRLKGVTLQDSGIYTCEAHVKTSRKKRSTDNDFPQYVELFVSVRRIED